eukprot:scaffold252813_cov32-Tisochrysis_lutea.AAC.1
MDSVDTQAHEHVHPVCSLAVIRASERSTSIEFSEYLPAPWTAFRAERFDFEPGSQCQSPHLTPAHPFLLPNFPHTLKITLELIQPKLIGVADEGVESKSCRVSGHIVNSIYLLHVVAQATPTRDVARRTLHPIAAWEVIETDPTSLHPHIEEGLQPGRDGCSTGASGLVERNHLAHESRKPLRCLPQPSWQCIVLLAIGRACKIKLDAL